MRSWDGVWFVYLCVPIAILTASFGMRYKHGIKIPRQKENEEIICPDKTEKCKQNNPNQATSSHEAAQLFPAYVGSTSHLTAE